MPTARHQRKPIIKMAALPIKFTELLQVRADDEALDSPLDRKLTTIYS